MAGPGLIEGASLVGGLIRQGEDIRQGITSMFDEHAKRRAGEAYANGDLNGAAGILASRGMLKDADALKGQATTTDALTALNGGDYTSAQAIAAQGGDPQLYSAVEAQHQKEIAQRAAWMGQAADALIQIKGQDEASTQALRHQAFNQFIAPTLKTMGMKDEDVAQISQGDLSDQGIQSFKASIGDLDKLSIQQNAETGQILGINPKTGAVRELYKGQPKPLILGKDQTAYGPDGKVIAKGGGGAGGHYEKIKNADGSDTVLWLPDTPDAAPPEGSAPVASGPPVGPVYDQIAADAGKSGAKVGEIAYLQRLAQVESDGDAKAKNGSSTGLFQFHPDTFASVGGRNINDPGDQTKAALNLARQNAQTLKGSGIAQSDANLYIMHQQGAAGGLALLQAKPDENAVKALVPAYGSESLARQAIVGNGGTPNMTAGEFVDYWRKRWNGIKSDGSVSSAGLPPGARVVAKGEGASEDAALTPEAVAMIGYQYLRYGPSALVNLGQGKAGVGNKQKILDWAAKTAKEAGTDNPELVYRFAQNKANQMAVNQVQKNLSLITASEATLAANLDLARQYANRGVGPTGVPFLDLPLNRIRAGLGSADAKTFDNLLKTTGDEYAKVLTTSTGSGGGATSDSARAEAHSMFNPGMTLRQFISAAEAAKAEAANRHTANLNERNRLLQEISGVAPKAAAPAPPAAPPPPPPAKRKSLDSIFK